MSARTVYADKDGHFVEISSSVNQEVQFSPQGGGFIRTMKAADFHARFKPAPAPTFKRALATGDWFEEVDAKPLACYMDDRVWNGWAMPYFEFEAAKEAVKPFNGRYDAARDVFIVPASDGGEEPEEFAACPLLIDGKTIKVYPIGAGSWCWDKQPMPTVENIGDEFADVLRSWLSDEQWDEMRKLNAEETDKGVCHSHDHCDANMAMDEAMRRCGLAEKLDADDWASNEENVALWNAAWDYAKAKHLTAAKGEGDRG